MSDPRDQSFSSVPPPPAAPRALPPAGWFPDPGGRHEHRYWDGTAWTDHVADRGIAGVDAVAAATPAAATATETPRWTTGTAPPAGGTPPPSVPATAAEWSAPQYGAASGPLRSLQGLRTAMTILLWASAGVAVLGVIAHLTRIAAVGDMINALDRRSFTDYVDAHGRAEDADTFVGVVALLLLALGITIFVLLIIWMWRLAKNAETVGRRHPRFGPGWTIGAWFIPFASLVIPVLVMQDLWRASDPESPRGDPTWRTRPGSALIGWWWAFWVAAQVLRIAGNTDTSANSRDELTRLRVMDVASSFGMLAVVVASVLLIRVVHGLTRRQQQMLGAMPPAG